MKDPTEVIQNVGYIPNKKSDTYNALYANQYFPWNSFLFYDSNN